MKLSEALEITEKPKGWSKSSYYRLRSVSARILKLNEGNVDVDLSNVDSVLHLLNLDIKYEGEVFKLNNRTYKTYITEIRRYIVYKFKRQKKWKLKKAS